MERHVGKPVSSMPSPAAPKRPAAGRALAAKPYHPGDLKRVLIDAALDLAEESGPEAVSVRRRRAAPECRRGRRSGISRKPRVPAANPLRVHDGSIRFL